MRKKLLPSPKSNQSRFLPSTLAAYRSGFNTRRTDAIDETLRLIEPVFAGPQPGTSASDQSFQPVPIQEELLRDLFLALRHLASHAQASENDADRKAYERAYTTCLEIVLLHHGTLWSPVFNYDIMTSGSGPAIPERAFRAAILAAGEPNLTLREIAEKMPGEYPPDYDDAAKRVQEDLMRTAKPLKQDSRGLGPRNRARTQFAPSAATTTKSKKPRQKK